MSSAERITFVLVGFCFCFASPFQECSCIDYKACIGRSGNVSINSTEESSDPCQGEEVMCCGSSNDDHPTSVPNISKPMVAPGGGCGRKRFPGEVEIIKGEKNSSKTAFYGEFPWMVVILDKNLNLRCGGTLISPKVVLTAAHCLDGEKNATNLFVRAGEYITGVTNKPIPPQTRAAFKLIRHSDYNGVNITNDIALIILEQPMELNAIVDVICTPEDEQLVIATECILTGFGFNYKRDSYQAVLKKMHYTYKSQEYCFEEWKNTHALKFYHKSNICGVANEDNGADLGDGGGPLFCPLQADPNKMVQIGIVSWEIVSEGKFPTSFTSVKHYLPWIREKLKELS